MHFFLLYDAFTAPLHNKAILCSCKVVTFFISCNTQYICHLISTALRAICLIAFHIPKAYMLRSNSTKLISNLAPFNHEYLITSSFLGINQLLCLPLVHIHIMIITKVSCSYHWWIFIKCNSSYRSHSFGQAKSAFFLSSASIPNKHDRGMANLACSN